MRREVAAVVFVVAALAVACGGDSATPTAATGAIAVTPGFLQLREVLQSGDALSSETPTCSGDDASACVLEHADDARVVLEGRDGSRYALGPALLSEDALASASAVETSGTWEVDTQLTADGATAFEGITRDLVGRQLAMVVRGVVLSTPTVETAISSGQMRLLGFADATTAKAVAAALDGAA